MPNSLEARNTMVEGQLKPDGVRDERILSAFRSIPRDLFLPPELKAVAYADEDIVLNKGRFLLEPSTHALMIQALAPKAEEAVLDVAAATGYGSAILANLCKTVVSLVQDKQQAEKAKKTCDDLGLYNIAFLAEQNGQCCPQYAPYPAIIMNGAVAELPGFVLERLAPGGRLVYIHRPEGAPIGNVTLARKMLKGSCSQTVLFQASTPYIADFAPRHEFVF